jgi:eukaryotic-like serine/threonine-protein kinase
MEFIIGDEIGRGGFCMVHKVTVFDDDGKEVPGAMAIKRLRDDLHGPSDTLEALRHRFEREARLLDDDLDHRNIVPVLYRNLSGDSPFFVMPLADCNVWDRVGGKVIDEEWACEMFRQILEGMAYAHGKNVIHRDLKPENALLSGSQILLSDLGLGKNLEDGTAGFTKTSAWYGTEVYMAPEQFTEMKDTGTAADVFSLGKLLIALLTGKHPDVGVPEVSGLPERFRYFTSRCCEMRPENRFADAKSALEAFDRAIGETGSHDPESRLEELVEAWFVRPEGDDLEVVEEIDQLLRENAAEESLFTKQVPALPADLLNQYMEELPDAFADMLAIYDDHVNGGLPFDYCDEVARLYARVFDFDDRLDLRKLIVRRLLDMGHSHHRYYVRERLLRTLSALDEATEGSTIAMTADEIRARPQEAGFVAEIASEYELPRPIEAALQAAEG